MIWMWLFYDSHCSDRNQFSRIFRDSHFPKCSVISLFQSKMKCKRRYLSSSRSYSLFIAKTTSIWAYQFTHFVDFGKCSVSHFNASCMYVCKFNQFTGTVYILEAAHGKSLYQTTVFIVFRFWVVTTSHKTKRFLTCNPYSVVNTPPHPTLTLKFTRNRNPLFIKHVFSTRLLATITVFLWVGVK